MTDEDPSEGMNEHLRETLTIWGTTITAQMRPGGVFNGDQLQAQLDADTPPPDGPVLIFHHLDGAPRSPEQYHPYQIPAPDAALLRDVLNAATERGLL